jgi:hypothetical protein
MRPEQARARRRVGESSVILPARRAEPSVAARARHDARHRASRPVPARNRECPRSSHTAATGLHRELARPWAQCTIAVHHDANPPHPRAVLSGERRHHRGHGWPRPADCPAHEIKALFAALALLPAGCRPFDPAGAVDAGTPVAFPETAQARERGSVAGSYRVRACHMADAPPDPADSACFREVECRTLRSDF